MIVSFVSFLGISCIAKNFARVEENVSIEIVVVIKCGIRQNCWIKFSWQIRCCSTEYGETGTCFTAMSGI
jgi:hypothetical protein